MNATTKHNDSSGVLIMDAVSNSSNLVIMKDESYWLNVVVLSTICIVGIFANISVIFVMSRRPLMVSRQNVLLTGLAAFDMLLLLFSVLYYPAFAECRHQNADICRGVQKMGMIIYPCLMTAQTASCWMCVCITVDRYIVLCHPLLVKGRWTVHKAKVLTTLVAVFAAIYSSPNAFHYLPEMQKSFAYTTIYWVYMYSVFLIILPVAFMLIFNALCVRAISLTATKSRDIQGEGDDGLLHARRRLTFISIGVAASYILFGLPIFAIRFIDVAVFRGSIKLTPLGQAKLDVAASAATVLVMTNSATNFMIYCALSPRFRKVFFETFCCRCEKYGEYSQDLQLSYVQSCQ